MTENYKSKCYLSASFKIMFSKPHFCREQQLSDGAISEYILLWDNTLQFTILSSQNVM